MLWMGKQAKTPSILYGIGNHGYISPINVDRSHFFPSPSVTAYSFGVSQNEEMGWDRTELRALISRLQLMAHSCINGFREMSLYSSISPSLLVWLG